MNRDNAKGVGMWRAQWLSDPGQRSITTVLVAQSIMQFVGHSACHDGLGL